MFKYLDATLLLRLAGAGQIVLIIASLAIPKVLGWREETDRLSPLTRQVFWTYAGYIWATNLCFGLVSLGAPHWLLDGSGLARAVCGFITAYWGARLFIQLFYFEAPKTHERLSARLQKLAERALTALFIGLTVVYGAATLHG